MTAQSSNTGVFNLVSFRLMASTFGGEVMLVRMGDSSLDLMALARRLAVRLAPVHGDRDGRIASLYIEKWIGSQTSGRWERLADREAVVRVPRAQPANAVQAVAEIAPLPPQSGEVVHCELLSEKTRAGGWRAKIVGHEAVGPIVNSGQIPSDRVPGDRVSLKVYGIKLERGFAQFAWLGA